MNAYKFVEQCGMKEANKALESAPCNWCFAHVDLRTMEVKRSAPDHSGCLSIADLEKAIADFELIEKVGGLDVAKKQVKQAHEQGYLTISVWMKIKKQATQYEGFGCLYIDKLEAAITRIEEGLRDEM